MSANQLRIITIARDEQVVIKVNSRYPITLELDGHTIQMWASGGMVFQRTETVETETQIEEEGDIECDDETQLMDDEAVLPSNITIRNKLTCIDKQDLVHLQMELYDGSMEAGETQLVD